MYCIIIIFLDCNNAVLLLFESKPEGFHFSISEMICKMVFSEKQRFICPNEWERKKRFSNSLIKVNIKSTPKHIRDLKRWKKKVGWTSGVIIKNRIMSNNGKNSLSLIWIKVKMMTLPKKKKWTQKRNESKSTNVEMKHLFLFIQWVICHLEWNICLKWFPHRLINIWYEKEVMANKTIEKHVTHSSRICEIHLDFEFIFKFDL